MRILKKFIRKLYHLIWFLTLFIIFISPVKAEIIGYQYLERTVGATFNISANSSIDSRSWVNVTGPSTRAYLVVDLCSTTGLSSSVPHDYDGSYTTFYNEYDLKISCTVSGYTGSTHRLFYNITTWADSGNGNQAINNTTRLYNASGWYGYYKILKVSLSDNVDLGDLTINNQNIIINSITNIQGSINSSTSSINGNINQKTQDIINNQNSTSSSIIDNQNRTSASIIDNQNENTNKQIESQKVCSNTIIDKKNVILEHSYLDNSGNITTNSSISWGITDYIKIEDIIKPTEIRSGSASTCFYTENKTLISCIANTSLVLNQNLTIPNNSYYARFSIQTDDNKPKFEIKTCKDGNQALNDNLTDSSIDSSDSTLSDLQSDLPTNNVISDLLLLPVRLLQAIVNSLGGSCSSFNLGSLYGTNLVMPCIDLESYLGSGIWTFIDLVFSGMFILVIRKKFIQIFQNITNLRSGGNEVD